MKRKFEESANNKQVPSPHKKQKVSKSGLNDLAMVDTTQPTRWQKQSDSNDVSSRGSMIRNPNSNPNTPLASPKSHKTKKKAGAKSISKSCDVSMKSNTTPKRYKYLDSSLVDHVVYANPESNETKTLIDQICGFYADTEKFMKNNLYYRISAERIKKAKNRPFGDEDESIHQIYVNIAEMLNATFETEVILKSKRARKFNAGVMKDAQQGRNLMEKGAVKVDLEFHEDHETKRGANNKNEVQLVTKPIFSR